MSARLEDLVALGVEQALGTHTFEAGEIKRFARSFDPQPFHLDEAKAARSVFGALCASGWHTGSVWMRLNVEASARARAAAQAEGRPHIEYGPSPGLRDIKWTRPVHAGDTIAFFRTPLALRARPAHDGWSLLMTRSRAENQRGEGVMSFDSAVLVRLAPISPLVAG